MIESLGYHTTNCPFCIDRGRPTPDTGKHLYVYGEGRGVHCFRCDYHTNKFVPEEVATDGDFFFAGQTGERRPNIMVDSAEWHLRGAKPALDFRSAKNYLNERGMKDDEIDRLGILYAATGDYAKRVIFAIRGNPDGPVQYFTGRSIRKATKPKYRNAPTPKNGFLYVVGEGERGIVCEGPFDAIRAAQAGYRGIALLGKSCNAAQARHIGRIVKAATVILDPDAFNKAIEVSVRLSYYVPTDRKETPAGTDLGDLQKVTIRAIMETGSSIHAQLTGVDDSPIYRRKRESRKHKAKTKNRTIKLRG